MHTYAKVPSTVASIDISPNGALLAVASSYTYERGEAGMGRAADEVYLHRIRDSEFRPRCAR